MNEKKVPSSQGLKKLGRTTKGVEMLLGDPKKAIIKLSLPMIVAMSVQTIYNLADAIWVSGLGADALAAVGFVFPFFFLIMALANGVGIGGGSAISRRIGARDKDGADNVADHIIILMIVISTLFTIPVFILLPDIFRLFQAGEVADLAVTYGRVIIGGAIIIFFANNTMAILRAEGDTKRAMFAMLLGSGLNIILDPFFIYWPLNLGIAGAAWATMISFTLTGILLFYWLFLKKDTFVSFNLRKFKFSPGIFRDIMRVGFPASLQMMSISLNMMALNVVVVTVGGANGVAVFSTGWRVVSMATLPVMGISTALVSIAGAAYGARQIGKLSFIHRYAIKFALMIELPMSVLVFTLAPVISLAFTWSSDSQVIRQDLILFLRIFVLMNFFIGFGMLSSATFQGMGKGFHSLILTILRAIVFALVFSILLGIVLDQGLVGVWTGILIGNAIGAIIAYQWVRSLIRRMRTS